MPAIHVVAAVLIDRRGRILIAQRPAGKHLAGSWEFPGGKLEPGETRTAALARELSEELGVAIEQHPRPLLRLRHVYPYGEVLLDVWVVRRYRGEPRGLDGQALRWCSRRELPQAELLPADRPIVAALRLPERLSRATSRFYELLNSEALASPPLAQHRGARRLRGWLCTGRGEAERATTAADFLVMREPLPDDELRALCARVDVPVYARGVTLGRAWALGATGMNLLPAGLPPT
jgi:mutator protein MutT